MSPRSLAASCLVLLLGSTSLPSIYGEEKPETLAQQVAESWLALVDARKYSESWEAASDSFKAALSKQKWEEAVRKARGPLGRVQSRKLKTAQYMKDPPNAPAGEYVGIQYDTSFSGAKAAIETVVPTLDKDGKWRVSGYYVQASP